jgi:hypothetical protein
MVYRNRILPYYAADYNYSLLFRDLFEGWISGGQPFILTRDKTPKKIYNERRSTIKLFSFCNEKISPRSDN